MQSLVFFLSMNTQFKQKWIFKQPNNSLPVTMRNLGWSDRLRHSVPESSNYEKFLVLVICPELPRWYLGNRANAIFISTNPHLQRSNREMSLTHNRMGEVDSGPLFPFNVRRSKKHVERLEWVQKKRQINYLSVRENAQQLKTWVAQKGMLSWFWP